MDDDIALCGSVNLDARSLFLNYEAMTAFYGAQEIRWLSDWCAQHIALAQPYDARRPSWTRDIAEGMVRSIAFQL
ncbi:cardiolipin synthetase [compost metagenome]